MNLHITKGQQAYWLPKALEGQQGLVDSDLLHTLWQQYPKNSAKIRTLIKDLSAVTLTPKDSAIDKLAELLPDPSFLSRWLTQGKNTYPSLIAIVSSYFEANEPNLCFESLKRIGFLVAYKKIKNKYLFDLSKIPDVIRFISESKLDRRYLSLFIWRLIIESQIAKSKFPGEPSLQEFENAFILALKNENLDELLDDAYAADWKWQASLCTEHGIKEEVIAIEEASTAKPNSATPPTARCIAGERFLAEAKALETKVEKYNSSYHNLFSKAKSLACDDDPTSTLRQIREYSAVLEELYVDLKNETCDLIARVNRSLELALQKLGLAVEHRQSTKFLITTSTQWFENVAERIELNSSVFMLLEEFEDIDIVSRLNEENRTLGINCKHEELQENIKRLADRYQRMVKGAAAEKEFDDAIKYNLSDLEWNIFQDLTLKNDTWEKLADYYILTENMSTRLGITVQRMFRSTSLAFGNLLSSQLLSCNILTISNCVHTLSWLTLGQQEQLAKTHPPLKTLVALSQLDAYFKALSQGLDFYIYWSTSPLGEISNSHASLTVREFFKSIYDIISAPEVEPLNSQSLALCVSSTQIGNARNKNEQASLDVFTDDLREILAYRTKGGRTTYAHIWQAAYDEIFSPLLDELNNHGVKEFITAYEKWQSVFEVEYRIDSWKSEIPEHLKKNSEYDKFIRNQVSLKTSEIDDWLDIYKSVTQKAQLRKTDPLANFKLKIDKIFNSSEQDCTLIRGWLESKTIDQKNKSNNYICQNRNWTADINCAASFKNVDAFHPRAFAKIIDRPITYENIYTDDLVASFGYGTSEHLVELYASNEIFEGYALIANDSNEEISPSLDRKVEKRIEELASKLKQRILVLEGGQSNACLKTALTSAQNHIENQQWRLAASEIAKAEVIAKDISENVKVLEERARLLSKIEQLGGHPDAAPDVENSKLTIISNDLLHAHRDLRLHIIVLEKLLNLDSTGFETQLLDCIEYLDHLNLYPSPAASELVAYYLEQAVDPIYSELSRSRTLLATYASQLRKLGKLLVLNIRHDQNLFEEGSNLIAMLVDTAEQWQSLSSEGKPGVDKILEVFIRRGFQESEELSGNNQVADTGHIPLNDQHVMDETDTFEELVARAKEIVAAGEDKVSDTKEDIAKLIHLKAWEAVAENSLIKLKTGRLQELSATRLLN